MRKLTWLAVAAIGCGGVSGPPMPKIIDGGGVADGKVNGNLFVYAIDEETRAVLSSASVRVGDSADPAPCTVVTDSTGLAKFQSDNCPGLKGPVTVTVSATGYAPVTWIGVDGTAQFTMDLGRKKTLRWVGCHVLNVTGPSIALPDSIKIETGSSATGPWTSQGTWPLGFAKSDGEYVIANSSPLSVTARYVRVTLANSVWTFISEVEVIGA